MIGFITKLMSLTQQTDGKCNEKNCQQNLCLHKEVMILFYTLLGSDYFLKEIYSKNYLHKSRMLVIGRFSKV